VPLPLAVYKLLPSRVFIDRSTFHRSLQSLDNNHLLFRYTSLTERACSIQSSRYLSGKTNSSSPLVLHQVHLCDQEAQKKSDCGLQSSTTSGYSIEPAIFERFGFENFPPTPVSPADDWWSGSFTIQPSSAPSSNTIIVEGGEAVTTVRTPLAPRNQQATVRRERSPSLQ
jgi:hypothetical protein